MHRYYTLYCLVAWMFRRRSFSITRFSPPTFPPNAAAVIAEARWPDPQVGTLGSYPIQRQRGETALPVQDQPARAGKVQSPSTPRTTWEGPKACSCVYGY